MLQCSRSISKINLQLPVAFVDYTVRGIGEESFVALNRANRHVYSGQASLFAKTPY